MLIYQLGNPMGSTKNNKELVVKSKEVSARLQSLRDIRNFADYDIKDDLDLDDHFGLMLEVKSLLRDLGVQFPQRNASAFA